MCKSTKTRVTDCNTVKLMICWGVGILLSVFGKVITKKPYNQGDLQTYHEATMEALRGGGYREVTREA